MIKLKNNLQLINNKRFISLSCDFWKNSAFFILFAFFNVLQPIFITLFAADNSSYGAQYASGISFITYIQIGFMQLSLTVVVSLFFYHHKHALKNNLLNKNQRWDMSLIWSIFVIILIYSALMVPIFIGSSYGYNLYASYHENILLGQATTFKYIYAVCFFIFFNTINVFLIFCIYLRTTKLKGIIALIFYNIVLVICIAIFVYSIKITAEKADDFGYLIGGGLSVGSFITTFIFGLYLAKIEKINYWKNKPNWIQLKFLFLSEIKQSLVIVTIQIFKAVSLAILFLYCANLLKQPAPMNIQFTRTLWYYIMFSGAFLLTGLNEAILFYGLQVKKTEYKNIEFIKVVVFTMLIGMIFQIILAIGLYYSMVPFGELLMKNASIKNPIDPKWLNANKVDLEYMINAFEQKIFVLKHTNNTVEANNLQLLVDLLKGKIPGLSLAEEKKLLILNAMAYNDFSIKIPIINTNLDLSSALNNASQAGGNLLTKNGYYSFIYLIVWTITYPIGMGLINLSWVVRQKYQDWLSVILTILVQAILIGTVFAIGVTHQQKDFLMVMDGWTVPFMALGPVIVLFGATKLWLFDRGISKIKARKTLKNKELKINKIK